MANTAQARKRIRQTKKARTHNGSLRSRLRTAIKAVRKAIHLGDGDQAKERFQHCTKVIDSTESKKLIHKNKAARQKSRLAAALKKLVFPSAAAE